MRPETERELEVPVRIASVIAMQVAVESPEASHQDGATWAVVDIPLPHGSSIRVRPVGAGDERGLTELYEALDPEDRYLRFFSSYRPSPEFVRRLTSPHDREARFVAELTGHAGSRIVGEAGYLLLPNGNGEFDMVIAREWRGWLGPYLLDLLVERAASLGLMNLEAEVLTCNRRMMGVLRRRGAVHLKHLDWSESRLMFGTTDAGPTWGSADTRPRVLVETPGGRWPLERAAEAAGMRVISCSGPNGHRACPMASGRVCALACDADVIVVRNAPADDTWQTVIAGHTAVRGDVPVVVDRSDKGGPEVTLDDVRLPAFLHRALVPHRPEM